MILDIIYCSLSILFISSCFEEGMIFGEFADWFDTKFPELSKPLFACIICMSPYYGSLYWFLWGTSSWLPFVLSVGGLNVLISYIYGRIRD